MKKIFLLLTLFDICLWSYSQIDIPKSLLKGIDIKMDEFSNTKTYYNKTALSIEENKDSVALFFGLSASTLDVPMILRKIHILTNGKTTIIEHGFNHKEQPERTMIRNSTGIFGTSNYKAAEFQTRIRYIDIWRVNADSCMELINSIIDSGGKVKFEGQNQNLFIEFNKKDATNMQDILALYQYLKQKK